jgi:hypothetical protein
VILSLSSTLTSSCIGERTAISVEHEATKCSIVPSSLRPIILHVAKGPLIRAPSTMKPPPKNSECWVIEILLCFFTKILLHFATSVAQAPSKSNALAEELNSARRIVQKTIRVILSDVDNLRPPGSQKRTDNFAW